MADVDMFLKIDGIKGESLDDKHKDTIQVLSYSLGVNNEGTGSFNQGSGAGRAVVHDITVTKFVDIASPNLFISSCSGKHLDKAWLYVRRAGGNNPQDYIEITLTEVFISSFHHLSSGDKLPQENITLNFAKIEFQYKTQTAKGTLGAAVKTGYDVKANKFS